MTSTRLATEADAAAVVRGGRGAEPPEFLVATFETEPRSADDIARLLKERAARWPTVVVERNGAVIAGAGAGRAAMEALVAAYAQRVLHKLVSRVFPENEASRKLLARVGFREVGTYRRHAKVDGEWRDTVIVERSVGEAAR